MSMWRFMAALDGWSQAHNPDGDNGLSAQEADDLWEWVTDGD